MAAFRRLAASDELDFQEDAFWSAVTTFCVCLGGAWAGQGLRDGMPTPPNIHPCYNLLTVLTPIAQERQQAINRRLLSSLKIYDAPETAVAALPEMLASAVGHCCATGLAGIRMHASHPPSTLATRVCPLSCPQSGCSSWLAPCRPRTATTARSTSASIAACPALNMQVLEPSLDDCWGRHSHLSSARSRRRTMSLFSATSTPALRR